MKNQFPICFLISFILLSFNITTLYSQSEPVISFERLIHDSGPIPEGPYFDFFFPFQNTGEKDLIITNLKSSCGCLAPYYSREPVKPGEWDTIYATFNTIKRPGKFNKSLTLWTNVTAEPTVLRVIGEVYTFQGKIKISSFPNDSIATKKSTEFEIKDRDILGIIIENQDSISMEVLFDFSESSTDHIKYFLDYDYSKKNNLQIITEKYIRYRKYTGVILLPNQSLKINIRIFNDNKSFFQTFDFLINDNSVHIDINYKP